LARIKRSALLAYSDRAMYDLVNDVPSYPLFMEGCRSVEVLEHTDEVMLARLNLKKSGVGLSLVTKNLLKAPNEITMTLEEGPFKIFLGLWTFTALTENACKVELDLNFEFKSKGLTLAVSSLFSGVANSLVDSLCQRAEQVYGAKNN